MTTNFKAIYDGVRTAIGDDPAQAEASFTAESRQVEGLRSAVKTRQFDLIVDEPEVLGGTDLGPNPAELILGALASCQEITYRLYADALDIPLDGVSVKVTGDLDLKGFFAADDNVRPGFRSIQADITLDSPASAADLERLRETVDRHCPVLDILQNPTPVALAVTRPAGAQVAAE